MVSRGPPDPLVRGTALHDRHARPVTVGVGYRAGLCSFAGARTEDAAPASALARTPSGFSPDSTVRCSTVLGMAKAARVLAALKRDGWTETRRSGSHRVLVKGDQQRIWAYHDGVDLGGPAMARIARDYGYTLAQLRKL
jgi:predicted RNA binding protein YcfA (HicA-like mRNA interferase family)